MSLLSVNKDIELEEFNDALIRILGILDNKEKFVITERYGLNDNKFKTFREVGEKLNRSTERIRQLESRALRRLRYYIARRGTREEIILKDYLLLFN